MTQPISRIAASDVLFKTTAGRAEVVHRRQRLSPQERALLIVVDGRQDVAALFAALGRQDADYGAATRLLESGLVERQGAGPSRAEGRRSLALARLYLIESAGRALRGRTDSLAPLLRAVTDEASLLHALDACHRALTQAGATAQADVIRTRCLDLLPVSASLPHAAKDR
jgi:hypothetical protein